MKRILALFCGMAILLTLFACAPAQDQSGSDKEKDLSQLTGTELYARAADGMALLPSYELETSVSGDAESVTWNTRRVRAGYDRFTFSRTKNGTPEGVYFDGETAKILSPEGNFSAPATTVTFQNFWEMDGFPVTGLNMEHFVRIERDGFTISYGEADETALSSFSNVADFVVTGIEGKAVIDEAMFIREEEIILTGTDAAGAARTLTLHTNMISHGEKDFVIAAPPADTVYLEVNDIRLPNVLRKARAVLLDGENLSVTLVTEESCGAYTRSVGGGFEGVKDDYSLRENVYYKE